VLALGVKRNLAKANETTAIAMVNGSRRVIHVMKRYSARSRILRS
jgi:hypothetical protein